MAARSKKPSGDTTSNVRGVAVEQAAEQRDEYLIVLTGGHMGQLFAVRGADLVIGRGNECEVRIEDDGVSRRQARLVREAGAVYLEDLGSRNGTFVNGQRLVGRVALVDGDRIQLGTGTVAKFALVDKFEAAYQRRMFEAAVKDALTGTYNRRHFHERIATELAFAGRHKTPLSLLMIDLDHFKNINDIHGHVVGDKILKAIARRLLQLVRAEDLLARYGGEEFAVLSRVERGGARVFAERLRQRIADRPFTMNGADLQVTISIGYATFPEVGIEQPQELISAADQALYKAKKNGRNRVETLGRKKGA